MDVTYIDFESAMTPLAFVYREGICSLQLVDFLMYWVRYENNLKKL